MPHKKLMLTLENDITSYINNLIEEKSAEYHEQLSLLESENLVLKNTIHLLENQLKEQQMLYNQQLVENQNLINVIPVKQLFDFYLPIHTHTDALNLISLLKLAPSLDSATYFNLFEQIYLWNEKNKTFTTEEILSLWIQTFGNISSDEFFERTYDLNFHHLFLDLPKVNLPTIINLLNVYFVKNKDYFYLFYDELLEALFQNMLSNHLKVITIIGLFYFNIHNRYYKDHDFQIYFKTNNSQTSKLYNVLSNYLQVPTIDDVPSVIETLKPLDSIITLFDIDRNLEEVYSQLLGTSISFPTNDNTKMQLSDESVLKQLGYQLTNRTEQQRWDALLKAVDQIGYNRVSYIIKHHINRNKSRGNYQNAVQTWKNDLIRLNKHFFKEV